MRSDAQINTHVDLSMRNEYSHEDTSDTSRGTVCHLERKTKMTFQSESTSYTKCRIARITGRESLLSSAMSPLAALVTNHVAVDPLPYLDGMKKSWYPRVSVPSYTSNPQAFECEVMVSHPEQVTFGISQVARPQPESSIELLVNCYSA